MKSTVKVRLKEYLKQKQETHSAFGRAIGVSAAYVNSITRTINPDLLKRICLNYPDLNIDWLLMGEGQMLKTTTGTAANHMPNSARSGNTDQSNHNLAVKREDVEIVETEEVELKETIVIRSDILNKEGIDLKKDLKKGNLDVEIKPTQDVLPPHQAKIYIGTDEMSPEIEANEPVFVKFLSQTHDFEDGYMYLVDLYHGSFVRWVVREDEDHVRLLSMKSEKVIPLSAVKSFAEVVAITKHPRTLPKERITMQEYIVHKDEQLDSILAQNDKLIEQHGRMIDIIEEQLLKK